MKHHKHNPARKPPIPYSDSPPYSAHPSRPQTSPRPRRPPVSPSPSNGGQRRLIIITRPPSLITTTRPCRPSGWAGGPAAARPELMPYIDIAGWRATGAEYGGWAEYGGVGGIWGAVGGRGRWPTLNRRAPLRWFICRLGRVRVRFQVLNIVYVTYIYYIYIFQFYI